MTNIICDMCKKSIPDASRRYSWNTRNERYDTILDKDICPSCLDKLDNSVNKEMQSSTVFGYKDYRSNAVSLLKKSCK